MTVTSVKGRVGGLKKLSQINASGADQLDVYMSLKLSWYIAVMSRPLPREDACSEGLLAIAGYWRKSAAEATDPWRIEMMRDTAKEFERAAARAPAERQ